MKIPNRVKYKRSYSPVRNTSQPPIDIQDLPNGTQETLEIQEKTGILETIDIIETPGPQEEAIPAETRETLGN